MNPKAGNKPNPHQHNPRVVTALDCEPGDDRATIVAKTTTRPSIQAAATIQELADRKCESGMTVDALANELQRQCNFAVSGDLRREEGMLTAQAHTLDMLFNTLIRRAIKQEHLIQYETYLRLALRAQSQCRTTVESLAAIKNPSSVAFVRQANIAHGPQQVNNGTAPSRAREIGSPPSQLLEANHGERLDTGTAGAARGRDPALATVGTIDGPENGRG